MPRSAPRSPAPGALLLTALACGPAPGEPPTGSPATAGSSTSSDGGDVLGPSDEPPIPTPDLATLDDDGPHGDFIVPPDGGSKNLECDLWTQDCPDGSKCNIWATDGGNAWNATKCTELDPDPDQPGEPCTVVESGVSGIDSCAIGSLCWNVDPATNTGTCVQFCQGGEANPVCADPTTTCEGRDFSLCLPLCCPLEQDCREGDACYPFEDTFQCAPDASGDHGRFGDPCEYLNVCDPGLFCASASSVPGCEGSSGCCSRLCDIGMDTCAALDPDLACVPWFAEGHAPPGFERVGGCLRAP